MAVNDGSLYQDVPGLIAQLKQFSSDDVTDQSLRQELYDTIRTLSFTLEAPLDTVKRICFAVSGHRPQLDLHGDLILSETAPSTFDGQNCRQFGIVSIVG